MSSAIPLALPKTMLPTPEGAASAGISSQWVRILPNNASQVVSAEATVSASATVPTQITLGAQQLNFDLPTGQGANVWCDTAKSTVSLRVRYEVTTAATTNYTGTIAYLQSSAQSYINRCTTYVAGQVVDDVTGFDVAMCEQLNWGLDIAQRDIAFNLGLRAEASDATAQNNLQGHSIDAFTGTALALGSSYFSYEVPFQNSLFGVGNRSMCPIGKLAKSSISLYTPQLAPIIILNGAGAAGAGAKVKITIDQIAINMFLINLDEPSMRLLSPKSEMYMAGITYRVGSGTIGASTSGSVSVQIPVRVKSCRELSTRFSESVVSTAASVNGQFDSKMPLASSLNYFIASQKRVPPVPHNTLIAPATVYSRAIMANYDSAYDSWKMKSSQVSDGYYSYVTTGTAPTAANCDQLVVTAGSATLATSLSSFSFCEDLRSASSSNFLSGQDLTVSNSFLELNISNSNTNALYVSFIAKADIIFVVLPDGSVESRV